MPESTIVKTKRDGTITFLDGAANSFTVEFEAGDLPAHGNGCRGYFSCNFSGNCY